MTRFWIFVLEHVRAFLMLCFLSANRRFLGGILEYCRHFVIGGVAWLHVAAYMPPLPFLPLGR